jgi:hypothetical protein
MPTPFAVASEAATPRDAAGRAVGSDGEPLFDTFDAQLTMAAAFLREDARLSVPMRPNDKTPFEKLGRGLPALFGLKSKRSVTYGKAKIDFDGLDPAKGPVYDLTHAIGAMAAKHPEVLERTLEAVEISMRDHEHEMTQLVDTMLRINERGKNHEEAVLVGAQGPGTPHRFWDDLMAVGVRMTKRQGMIEALIRMIIDPASVQQGPLFATWMTYKDVAKYRNADFTPGNADDTFTAEQEEDLNAEVTEVYDEPVDRTMPDVGNNRSVWQRTMSLIHNLKNRKQCNKEGAKLHLLRHSSKDLLIIISPGQILPLDPAGYKECDFFEVPDMPRIYSQSALELAQIKLKPADIRDILGIIVDTGEVQEVETQIHGFNAKPTAQAFARFLFAPPNQFSKGLIDPPLTAEGVRIDQLEPYALFAMEVKHPNAGNLSFLEAGRPMLAAFEEHELTKDDENGVNQLVDGYMFAELLSTFHMHWGSRRTEECKGPPEPTCTQSVDPTAKFFSYQTDLRSYEPLLAEAFGEERLVEVLSQAAKAMSEVKIDGKDGVTILAEFVEMMLKPDDTLTYRDGRTTALNNLGEEVGYVTPFYLLLDGLKQIDNNFAAPENEGRQKDWHAARSDMVDLFLAVEDVNGQKRLKDRVARGVFLRTVGFLRERINAHIEAKDAEEWGVGLAPRLVTFADTPLMAGLLHLIDKSWEEPAAGRELMRLIAYLVDETKNPKGFESTLVAASDLFQLLEDSEKIAPILDLVAEAVAPGVTKAVDSTGGNAFSADDGILRRLVELQNNVLLLHTKRPSTLSLVLRNSVSDSMGNRSTPLEALIDVITELERVDANKPSDATLDRNDLAAIAKSVHTFMTSEDKGLERLYDVIQHRTVDQKQDDQ